MLKIASEDPSRKQNEQLDTTGAEVQADIGYTPRRHEDSESEARSRALSPVDLSRASVLAFALKPFTLVGHRLWVACCLHSCIRDSSRILLVCLSDGDQCILLEQSLRANADTPRGQTPLPSSRPLVCRTSCHVHSLYEAKPSQIG